MVAFSTWWDAHLGDSPCRKWYDLLSEWFMPLVIERSCHTWEKGCLSGAEGSSTCPWHCFCWTSVNQQSSPFHIPPHLPSRHTCYIFSFYLSKTQLNCYSPWASTGLHEGKRYQCHSCMWKNNPQKAKKKEGGGEERKKPEAEYAYMFAISSIFWWYFSFSLFVSFYSASVSLFLFTLLSEVVTLETNIDFYVSVYLYTWFMRECEKLNQVVLLPCSPIHFGFR